MHGGARQSELARQGAHAPAALKRGLLADAALHFFPDLGAMLGGTARARGVLQPLPTEAGKAPSPFAGSDLLDAERSGDLLIRLLAGGGQGEPTPQNEALRGRRGFHELLKLRLLHMI